MNHPYPFPTLPYPFNFPFPIKHITLIFESLHFTQTCPFLTAFLPFVESILHEIQPSFHLTYLGTFRAGRGRQLLSSPSP